MSYADQNWRAERRAEQARLDALEVGDEAMIVFNGHYGAIYKLVRVSGRPKRGADRNIKLESGQEFRVDGSRAGNHTALGVRTGMLRSITPKILAEQEKESARRAVEAALCSLEKATKGRLRSLSLEELQQAEEMLEKVKVMLDPEPKAI